jgi:hypothetical protein
LFYFGLLHDGRFAQTVADENARNDRLFAKYSSSDALLEVDPARSVIASADCKRQS